MLKAANPGFRPMRSQRWGYGVGLGMAIAPVLGAVLYNQGWRMPGMHCLFQALLGFPGPGCGLTRSLMAIARGDLLQSMQYHLFGPLLFGLCCVSIIVCGRALTSNRPVRLSERLGRGMQRYSLGLGAIGIVFGGYYLLRLYAWSGADGLPGAIAQSSLWQVFATGAQAL